MADDQRKSSINWEEEFAKLDPEFKEDVTKFSEIHCYFIINVIGDMCRSMNRRLSHPERPMNKFKPEMRIQLDKDMYEMRVKQAYVVLQLTRFGLENPTKGVEENYEPTEDFRRWFDWWHNYAQKELSADEWSVLEAKINNGEDVSEYRPSGDWRNPQGVGDGGKSERLKKLGVG